MMKGILKKLVSYVMLLATLLAGDYAFAWAHIHLDKDFYYVAVYGKYLATGRKNLLLFKILQGEDVRFCISSEEPQFMSEESLAVQATVALESWLKPLRVLGSKTKSMQVPCSDPKMNLRIREVATCNGTGNCGAAAYETELEGPFSSVTLIHDADNSKLRSGFNLVDFKKYFSPNVDFRKALRNLVFHSNLDKEAFAKKVGVPPREIFWSSFPGLLHEIGHSFGLDDTYGRLDLLDPDHSTPGEQPPGVMKVTGMLRLAQDDIDGIQSIYLRFKNNIPVFQTSPPSGPPPN